MGTRQPIIDAETFPAIMEGVAALIAAEHAERLPKKKFESCIAVLIRAVDNGDAQMIERFTRNPFWED